MAKNAQYSVAARNAAADARLDLLDGGTMEIYDGAQPATADTAITTQTLLATLTFGAPAFAPAANGVKAANTITEGTAVAAGTAAWCRCKAADGTVIVDGSVGTASANVVLSTTSVPIGGEVAISSCTFTEAASSSA